MTIVSMRENGEDPSMVTPNLSWWSILLAHIVLCSWLGSSRAQERPVIHEIDFPGRAWTVANVQGEAFLFSIDWLPEHFVKQDLGRIGGKRPWTLVSVCRLPFEEGAPMVEDLHWVPLSTYINRAPAFPQAISALSQVNGNSVLVAGTGFPEPYSLNFAWIPRDWLVKQAKEKRAEYTEPADVSKPIEWHRLSELHNAGAGPDSYGLSVVSPTLGYFAERDLVAGETRRRGTHRQIVWVARTGRENERRLEGVLLGRGRCPILVKGGKILLCLAIEQQTIVDESAYGKVAEGSLIAWATRDGNNWNYHEPNIPGTGAADVFGLGACSDGKTGVLVYIRNRKSPEISVLQFDDSGGKFREIRSLHLEPKGEISDKISVQTIDGCPHVFWEEKQKQQRKIFCAKIRIEDKNHKEKLK